MQKYVDTREQFFERAFEEYSPIAFINLSAIQENARLIKEKTKTPVCAVVKSDAYGHGLVECARALENICDCFAVATLSEGVKLKIAGIRKTILCLLPVKNIERAIYHQIEFAVHNLEYAFAVQRVCREMKTFANVHIAVNSGMNRLGFDDPQDMKKVFSLKNLQIKGIFSHLCNPSNVNLSKDQLERFLSFKKFLKDDVDNVICHISSSGGIELGKTFYLDMIRIGLGIYGYNAVNGTLKLKPAMKILAPTVQERKLHAGDLLLYGGYKIKSEEDISICGCGYANGFRKGIKNSFNNACMNLCAMSGYQKYHEIMANAQEFANRNNTIPYEVLTSFGGKCKRIYYYGD